MERDSASRSAPTSPLFIEEASERALSALSKHCFSRGKHALAKIGYDGMRPFAPEQIATEFLFKLADRSRQRGLRNTSAARVKLSVRATARKYRT